MSALTRERAHTTDLMLGSGRMCARCDNQLRGSATIDDKFYCHPSCTCHPDCYKHEQLDRRQDRR